MHTHMHTRTRAHTRTHFAREHTRGHSHRARERLATHTHAPRLFASLQHRFILHMCAFCTLFRCIRWCLVTRKPCSLTWFFVCLCVLARLCAQAADSGEVREYLYKVLVVGEANTGKTSIIKRFVHGIFSNNYKSTIGVDFALKVLEWSPNTIVRLQLWDIAGQERFGNMTRVYYKEALAAIVVFDVSAPKSFEAVERWKHDIDDKVKLADGGKIPVVLLANKSDLLDDLSSFYKTKDEMDAFCEEHGFHAWFFTSAKNNWHIEDAAASLVQKILENDTKNKNAVAPVRDEVIRATDAAPEEKKKGGCC